VKTKVLTSLHLAQHENCRVQAIPQVLMYSECRTVSLPTQQERAFRRCASAIRFVGIFYNGGTNHTLPLCHTKDEEVQVQETKYQVNSDCLALVSSRAVLAATMLRIKPLLRGITERLLATRQRLNTSLGRARKHLVPTTTAVDGCDCDHFSSSET